MRAGQMVVRMAPELGGSYTRVWARGVIPSAVPDLSVRRALAGLAMWSGWPVRLVLSADVLMVPWLEYWTTSLSRVPARHHELVVRSQRA